MLKASGSPRLAIGSLAVIAVFAAVLAWLTDAVTLQGERTIYTVECDGGRWDGQACTGRLVAGDRYRFRALRSHGEVLFWRVGAAETSARLPGCDIRDGRNWKCPPGADAAMSITLEMAHGEAVRDGASPTRAFHAVPKWRWLLLRRGLPAGSAATDGSGLPD